VPETKAIRLTLNLSFVVALIVVAVLFGIGDLVTNENLGLWLRFWALVTLPAFGLLCLTVHSRLH
jgi:ABC-type multidrug transport system permease subunit